jgi:iron complex transport system ATP-binding protein
MTGAALLAARALAVGYHAKGSVTIVAHSIAFSLHAGTAIAVLGPNGAGKTTLFRTLLGLQPPCRGEVLLQSRAINTFAPTELAGQLAYVPQAHGAMLPFRVQEVVEMARAPHMAWTALPSAQDRAIAHGTLEQLGIANLADRIFTTLSGGEQQLVLLARALASGARCLLLDEPTASLDFGNRLRVQDELLKLKAQGYALMFTTHEPQQAVDLADGAADRTLTIARDGSTHFVPTAEATTRDALAALYGVDAGRIPELN